MSECQIRFGSIDELDVYSNLVILCNMHGSWWSNAWALLFDNRTRWLMLLWHCWRLYYGWTLLLRGVHFNHSFLFHDGEIGAWLCCSSWIFQNTCENSRIIQACIVDDQSGCIVLRFINSDIISTLEWKCISHPFDNRSWTGFKLHLKNCFLVLFYTHWF